MVGVAALGHMCRCVWTRYVMDTVRWKRVDLCKEDHQMLTQQSLLFFIYLIFIKIQNDPPN